MLLTNCIASRPSLTPCLLSQPLLRLAPVDGSHLPPLNLTVLNQYLYKEGSQAQASKLRMLL